MGSTARRNPGAVTGSRLAGQFESRRQARTLLDLTVDGADEIAPGLALTCGKRARQLAWARIVVPSSAKVRFLPQVMKSVLGGQSNTAVGMAVMIPNLLGLIAMVVASRHSDRTLERRYHLATLGALAGIAFLLLGVPRSPFFSVVLFSAVAVGAYSFLPIFFSLPGEFLTGFSAAAGIAVVTSVANFGGFVGPYTVGLIRQRTGSFYSGLICAGISFLVSTSLAFLLPKRALPTAGERLGAADVDLETNPKALLEES
jgi:MFS family permease